MVAGTPLKGIEIRALPSFEDTRGSNVVLYEYYTFSEDHEFLQDNISTSRYNVLRGIHGDMKTWKAITCLTGSIYFVVVAVSPYEGLREKWNGDHAGDWVAIELTDENRYQVLVPPGYGNGHYVMSAFAMFHYKLSEPYDLESQFSFKWDAPEFGITWPCTDPILSERDQ
jgi:dTDP-4-dehydrorhamnose 3,5-epimerase